MNDSLKERVFDPCCVKSVARYYCLRLRYMRENISSQAVLYCEYRRAFEEVCKSLKIKVTDEEYENYCKESDKCQSN